jgi:hypothetical protein
VRSSTSSCCGAGGRADGPPGEVYLPDPPVLARCTGPLRTGRTARVRLVQADPETGRLAFRRRKLTPTVGEARLTAVAMTSEPSAFRYGIEHEAGLLRSDGTFADFTNTTFAELAAIVDELPEDPADWQDLRVGDVGIKRKRWYIEGYERFDEHGRLLRCDPKGLEIRTRIHDDIDGRSPRCVPIRSGWTRWPRGTTCT